MTGKEVKQARKRLNLSQAKLAARLGVTSNTVARWEWGAVNMPEPAARLLRLLVKVPGLIGKVE
jgi:putative transcriptional regulator